MEKETKQCTKKGCQGILVKYSDGVLRCNLCGGSNQNTLLKFGDRK